MAARVAAMSRPLRSTRITPTVSNIQRMAEYLKYSLAIIHRTSRGQNACRKTGSMLLVWLETRIAGPRVGKLHGLMILVW